MSAKSQPPQEVPKSPWGYSKKPLSPQLPSSISSGERYSNSGLASTAWKSNENSLTDPATSSSSAAISRPAVQREPGLYSGFTPSVEAIDHPSPRTFARAQNVARDTLASPNSPPSYVPLASSRPLGYGQYGYSRTGGSFGEGSVPQTGGSLGGGSVSSTGGSLGGGSIPRTGGSQGEPSRPINGLSPEDVVFLDSLLEKSRPHARKQDIDALMALLQDLSLPSRSVALELSKPLAPRADPWARGGAYSRTTPGRVSYEDDDDDLYN